MIQEIILPCGCHKIDSNGNVYSSLEQFSEIGKLGIRTRRTNKWSKLNLTINTRSRYLQVKIHEKLWRVNRLIAYFFLKNKKGHPFVLHNNGDKQDNRVSNLRWGTARENTRDALRHGDHPIGSRNGNSKLNESKVKAIRENKESSREFLAKKYNVDRTTIDLVINNKIWKHVK